MSLARGVVGCSSCPMKERGGGGGGGHWTARTSGYKVAKSDVSYDTRHVKMTTTNKLFRRDSIPSWADWLGSQNVWGVMLCRAIRNGEYEEGRRKTKVLPRQPCIDNGVVARQSSCDTWRNNDQTTARC